MAAIGVLLVFMDFFLSSKHNKKTFEGKGQILKGKTLGNTSLIQVKLGES